MSKRNLVWLGVIAAIALGFYRLVLLASQQDSVYRTYAPLVEADALIRQKFVEPIEDDRLVEGAIRGMMLKLDPYSGYIGPEELTTFWRRASGKYIGIGVHLGVRDGQLTVIAPIEQSPAVSAGVQAGDVILAIDEVSSEGMGVADADHLLSGDPGSDVTLTVRHPRDGQVESLRITRGPINLWSVKGCRQVGPRQWDYLIDPEAGIAYIRVSNFRDNTMTEFDRALEQVRSLGAAGLIVDLRFNPGGSLKAAVAMVDRFVESGLILSTVTRHKAKDIYKAKPEGTIPPLPMAVLINEGSASASEIVAGSLQDHGRAVIVGTRSFGKGVVQNVLELTEHRAAISLTVAHYRLPNGRVIHKTPRNSPTDEWGVLPDLVVEIPPEQELAIQERRRQVDRAPSVPATAPADEGGETSSGGGPEILIDDQLAAALSELRARLEASAPSTLRDE